MPLTSPRPTLYPDRALLSRRHAPQLNARHNSNRWISQLRRDFARYTRLGDLCHGRISIRQSTAGVSILELRIISHITQEKNIEGTYRAGTKPPSSR
jgi:hypothetical protein